MSLSVLIVNWNTCDLLRGCLESIAAHPPDREFEVIVVDNASTDGSAEMLRQHFPQVLLIQNATNVGFARASNQAAQQAQGQYLLLLNPDTRVHPGALGALQDHLESHPGVGAVGPCLLNADGSLQVSAHPAPTLLREAWRLLHLDALIPVSQYPHASWQRPEPRAVDVLMGACILLRREIIEQIGLFDEQFFVYSEEVDLCQRIRQAGWLLHWLPSAVVTHFGGQSTQQIADQMFLELYRNKIKYFRKHHGKAGAWLYKAILWPHTFARALAVWSPRARAYQRLLAALPNY